MNTSTEWAESPEHPGYKCKTIKHGACTIHILRPDLGESERAKREAHLKNVAESTLRDYYKRRAKEERKRTS
jgi:hypothetical protein